jgi:hypothetical protein
MRFFLFLVVILALAGLAVKKLFFSADEKAHTSIIAKLLPSGGSSFSSDEENIPPPSIVPYQGHGLAAVSKARSADTISSTYTFLHRVPPDGLGILGASFALAVASDLHTRSVFFSGDPLSVADFSRYLQSIDTVGGACAVQTWAIFVDKKASSGFDLVATINSLIPTRSTATIGNGAFVLNIGTGDLSAALKIIADGSTVEVLQRPHVRLEHGRTSVIESIQEVPVPSTTTSQGIAQTSIDYRKVGLQLSVMPYFLGADRVQLSVKQSNGLIGNTVQIAGNEVPVIQSQTVDTSTTISIGQTVILGGVSTRRETLARGFLKNTKEVTEGSLYVILSTFDDTPKALPVINRFLPSPSKGSVPFSTHDISGAAWIDGEVLPPLFK